MTEVAANPLGTGPPAGAVAGVVAGLVAVGLAAPGVEAAGFGAPEVAEAAVELAPAPGPELAAPHPARDSPANSTAMPTATPDARIEILMSSP